jgi:hypothetical protein
MSGYPIVGGEQIAKGFVLDGRGHRRVVDDVVRVLRRAAAVRCFVCLALLTARLSLNTVERMSLAEHPVPRVIFAAT